MQARFYLPMYGRFASPDPARDQHFEETQSWNIYSYVRNNPVMMVDPDGQESLMAHYYVAQQTYFQEAKTNPGQAARNFQEWQHARARGTFGGVLAISGLGLPRALTALWRPVASMLGLNEAKNPGSTQQVIQSAQQAVQTGTSQVADKIPQNAVSFISRIDNIIKGIKPHDISGTLKDMAGSPVVKNGKVYDHLKEMQQNIRGLERSIDKLKGIDHKDAQAAVSRAQEALKGIREKLAGHGI